MNDASSDNITAIQTWVNQGLFCADLPTKFQPNVGKILVTGASGYIGGRLAPELLARGYKLRVMVRGESPGYNALWPNAEVVVADARQIDSLRIAFRDIDTAYYLIHSLRLGPQEFASADMQAARNFRQAAEEMNVKRIIYLGGLGDIRGSLSSHLRSRAEVAEELKKGKVPVTILRAAVIVGSGSASYEIIQHLVKKLWIIPVPRWAKNRCQPIAIRDVIKYLVGVLEAGQTSGRSFDIGGPDILTYEMMLEVLGGILKKKILFLPVSFSNIRFYAYIASLLTPVPVSITECLMEGLQNEVVCQDQSIRDILPFEPLSYKEALVRAILREKQDRVSTRWSDAYPAAQMLAMKLGELKNRPAYIASYSIITEKSAALLFNSICRIGGREGWFHSNWLWRLRGGLDRILLGVGTARGRKSQSSLKINDVVDFWRIEDLQEGKKILLRAEMKLPGKAWLEFTISPFDNKNKLSVTAYYVTQSFFGRMYWYLCLPFHHFIFYNLIREIDRRS